MFLTGEKSGSSLRSIGWLCLFLALTIPGCHTPPNLPQADLGDPAWQQQRGQALWQPPPPQREIAGELLVATRQDGTCFIQFSKEPFSIVSAQADSQAWSLSFGPEGRKAGGPGKPSPRWVWFQIARLAAGLPLHPPWENQAQARGQFRLENRKTGETLEGFLGP